MSIKSGIRLAATLVVVVVLFTGYKTYVGAGKEKHELILSLVYIPLAEVKGNVGVKVRAGGKILINEKHVGTPWAATVKVSEGSIVTFTSTKNPLDFMTMACTIHDTNGNLHDQQSLDPRKNEVVCKASVL